MIEYAMFVDDFSNSFCNLCDINADKSEIIADIINRIHNYILELFAYNVRPFIIAFILKEF